MSANSSPLKSVSHLLSLCCHFCSVVGKTDVPNLCLSRFYKSSNPIASYCLHLSPVLPLPQKIGSPRRCFLAAPLFFTWNVWARRDGGASWHCVIPIFWSSVISDWTYWIIDLERKSVFVAMQGSTRVWRMNKHAVVYLWPVKLRLKADSRLWSCLWCWIGFLLVWNMNEFYNQRSNSTEHVNVWPESRSIWKLDFLLDYYQPFLKRALQTTCAKKCV